MKTILLSLLAAVSWHSVISSVAADKRNNNTTRKKALFVNHVNGATEVSQMLMIADELKSRGHDTEFLVVDAYQNRVENHGHKVIATVPSLDKDRTAEVFKLAVAEDTFDNYVNEFFPAVIEFYSGYYEPAVKALIKHFEENGKPDCLISSMFSDNAIDVANHYEIPLAIIYATPLGSIAGHDDHVAAIDTNFWAPVATAGSFVARLNKLYATIRLIMSIIPKMGHVASMRDKYGFKQPSDPSENWKRAAVFHTFSFGFEPSRPTRPLTYTLGFLSTPYEEKALSSTDQDLKRQLDEYKGGVVYVAFGSLAILKQDMFDHLIAGLDQWVQSRKDKATAIFTLNPFAMKAGGLDTSKVPSTVKMLEWTNQKLILNHPNCEVFLTHAGQGSIAEALNAQVPMLAVPLFGDQPSNSFRVEEAGIGLRIHFREEPVTADKIASRLINITEPNNNAMFMKNLARQQLINARSGGAPKAADVVEDMFLLGHLDHLVPVTDNTPYPASINLDIWMLFFAFLGVIFYGMFKACKLLFALVSTKTSKDPTKQKTI